MTDYLMPTPLLVGRLRQGETHEQRRTDSWGSCRDRAAPCDHGNADSECFGSCNGIGIEPISGEIERTRKRKTAVIDWNSHEALGVRVRRHEIRSEALYRGSIASARRRSLANRSSKNRPLSYLIKHFGSYLALAFGLGAFVFSIVISF